MTKAIAVGITVTDDTGHEYRYGGEDEDRGGMTSISFDMRFGGLPTIKCSAGGVAPIGQVTTLDKKDPRIVWANDKAGRPGTWTGTWRAQAECDEFPHWHKTKTEALERAARRLAIADWHNTKES